MLNLPPSWLYGDFYEVAASRLDRRTESPRTLQDRHAEDYCSTSFRNCAPRARIQKTGCAQSSKTRPKTEAEIRFPRFCRRRLEWRRGIFTLASQSLVGKPLAHDLRNRQFEAATIVHLFPVVVAESLFVDISEQVKRLYADVGAVQSALKQAPKVLDSVGVDVSADVFDSMIDDGVIVIVGQPLHRT